jgi:hypothetical protein
VLFLYFYNWQSRNSRCGRFVLFPSRFGFLLRDSANHFKDRIRLEILVEICHEVVRAKLIVLSAHPQEFMARKHVHEGSQQIIHQIFDLLTAILLLRCAFRLITAISWCIGPPSNEHELWRWHLNSTQLYVVKP